MPSAWRAESACHRPCLRGTARDRGWRGPCGAATQQWLAGKPLSRAVARVGLRCDSAFFFFEQGKQPWAHFALGAYSLPVKVDPSTGPPSRALLFHCWGGAAAGVCSQAGRGQRGPWKSSGRGWECRVCSKVSTAGVGSPWRRDRGGTQAAGRGGAAGRSVGEGRGRVTPATRP